MGNLSTISATDITTLPEQATKPANIGDEPSVESFDLAALSAQMGALSTYLCIGGTMVGRDELKIMFPGGAKPFAIKWQPELSYLIFVLPPLDDILEKGCYVVEPRAEPLSVDNESREEGI